MSNPLKKVSALDSRPGSPSEPVTIVTSHPASGRKRARLRVTCEEPPRGKNMSAITTRGLAMRRVKLATEDDRAGHGAPTEQRQAVLVARAVVQRAARHERCRCSAAEIDRRLGAQVGHQLRQFGQRHAGVADRTAIADDREEAIAGDAERGAWMPPGCDVVVELAGPGAEALGVTRIGHAQ